MSSQLQNRFVAFLATLIFVFSLTITESASGFLQQSATEATQEESAQEEEESEDEDVVESDAAEGLWKAARAGDLEAVKLALDEGVEVDAKTEYGATALFFACDRGHEEVVRFLLEKGADPNSKDTFYKATPMTWAQMKDNKNIVGMLLEKGGDGAGGIFLGAINEGDVEFAKSILKTGVVEKEDLIKARDAVVRNEELSNREEYLEIFKGMSLPAYVEVEKLSPEALKKYAGKFKAENFTVTVEANDIGLKLGFGESEKTALSQVSDTEFLLGTTSIKYEFEAEKVKTLKMTFGENEMELTPVTDSSETDSEEMKEGEDPENGDDKASEETEDEAEFGPSSAESRQADLAISSANWPGFRGNGARGVADGQHPPIQWHVAPVAPAEVEPSSEKSESKDEGDKEDGSGEEGSQEAEAKSLDEANEDAKEETSGESEETETQQEEETKAVDKETPEEPVRADENLKWKTSIPGLGLSCPTVWGDKIYLTSAVPEEKSDQDDLRIGLFGDVDSVEDDRVYEFKLFCYSKTDGELVWEKTTNKCKPAVKRHSKSSHANPTVATDGGHVVAFFGTEGLYCYSSAGELAWKTDFGLLDSGWFYDPGYQWGFASSPIIHNGKVIVQCDIQGQSFVVAIELKTGEEIWRTQREEIPTWSTPTVHQFEDVTMLITAGTKAARGYDISDGSLLWTLKGHSEIVVPTPFVAHDMIFIASGYSPIQPIYAIQPSARGDISLGEESTTNESIAWSVKRGGPYMPTPIVYGDYLYSCANNGILTCYVAKTGEQVYKERIRVPGGGLAFSASPLAADGHLFLASEDGRVVIVKAGSEFEVVETNELNESVLATPAISDGVIYFRTQNSLIAIGK